jgi:F-type H+-transporting ATPase subunit b
MRTLTRSLPRLLSRSLAVLALATTPLLAQEHGGTAAEGGSVNLLDPHAGLMFWTLLIFVGLFVLLSKFAFKPILSAVEARERALEDSIEGAKRDRDEAARLLAEQRAAFEGSRAEAQKLLAETRVASEQMRAEMLEQTRVQQAELLERAKKDIEGERLRAIADLRREAVDLALAGASRVIQRNLDDAANRQIVEQFLGSLPTAPVAGAAGAGSRG